MEGEEGLVNGGSGNSVNSGSGNNKGKGDLAEEVLVDLEEYWEDITDRLMISRMVSDSVTKGMVTAMEQEIALKELEVAKLKEFLLSHKVGGGRSGEVHEVGTREKLPCLPTPSVNKNMREELHALKNLAIEQLINVKKEIQFARTSNSSRKTGSGSEWVGLGSEILPEKQSERWVHIDKMLENLEKTMETVCTKVDGEFLSSKVSFGELQQERYLLANLEGLVIESVFRSLKEEFEAKLWEQNNQFSRIQSVNWLGKFHELSNVGAQLDAILKSLSIHDQGFVSHGSHDVDQVHHKVFNNHVCPPASRFGENGALDASNIHVVEVYDFQQLKHLSKEEMVDYFNDIITKMKRDHESSLHQKTEEYFRLKREYLKERSSFMTHSKDEEFDVLRKKIPEVISKLEGFLLENERFPALTYTAEIIGEMKHRLESLLSENQQLRDCLTDKKNEVKHLEAQVLQHSLSEETMLKLVENLNSAVEESRIEASLKEEEYKCALREAISSAEMTDKYENEDSEIESLIAEGFCGLIYSEAIKDAEQNFNDLSWEVQRNKEIVTCLEVRALEKENELRQVIEEKEKLAIDLSVSLSKEREQFELASQELGSLRQHANQQQTLVTERNRELQLLSFEHSKALEQIQSGNIEMHKLNQMLDQTEEQLTEANKQRNITFSHTQELHGKLLSIEGRDEKLKKEVEMAVSGLSKLFDDFECRVSGAIKKNSLRLADARSHSKSLNGIANVLKRKGLMYKQRLERRYADLQMAEVEVDLLGDEVDALLRLLEKIYIALDHYSPILKHYPGIMEILKLVRRELTGDSTKIS